LRQETGVESRIGRSQIADVPESAGECTETGVKRRMHRFLFPNRSLPRYSLAGVGQLAWTVGDADPPAGDHIALCLDGGGDGSSPQPAY
jgi:hypothetical protein